MTAPSGRETSAEPTTPGKTSQDDSSVWEATTPAPADDPFAAAAATSTPMGSENNFSANASAIADGKGGNDTSIWDDAGDDDFVSRARSATASTIGGGDSDSED